MIINQNNQLGLSMTILLHPKHITFIDSFVLITFRSHFPSQNFVPTGANFLISILSMLQIYEKF
jgi:hypothetical protein